MRIRFIKASSLAIAGFKISVGEPSDKMFDDFEFGSDICIVMSNGCPMTLSSVWLGNKYI